MKRTHRIAMGIVAASGLALSAAVAHAHPGMGMGPWGAGGYGAGQGYGPMRGMGYGPMGGAGFGQQLLSSDERAALAEKMRNAKTPEERLKLAQETRALVQERAKEQGITFPEGCGPMAFGPAVR